MYKTFFVRRFFILTLFVAVAVLMLLPSASYMGTGVSCYMESIIRR